MDAQVVGIQLEDIKAIRERFVKANENRIAKTKQLMRANQTNFLDILPLLFHINHPSLPGFSGHDAPNGVSAYLPSGEDISLARKLWRNFELVKQTNWVYDIHSIFIIGSAGSVAFNRKSDFDIWLCYRPDLTEGQRHNLGVKADGIERWAETLGLEVHFFLMDADKFRHGEVLALSSESSGSAQRVLLLEEFYRTSIWVAGKQPLWWFIPPDREHEYETLKTFISENTLLADGDFIDLGGLAEIPNEEYVGAALWQINKGVDAPYKSVLKMTLMESYASQYPNARPLCSLYKQEIYEGNTDMLQTDPYLLLLRHLEKYLIGQDERLRLELIRRSFYFKLDLPLSHKSRGGNWRYQVIKDLVKEWGWNEQIIELLDNRKAWTIKEVQAERKLLVEHLTKSYLFLSTFAKEHQSEIMIEQKDLTVLGRKLYSVFERRPGKVEIVNRGIASRIYEEKVSYIMAYDKEKRERWFLYHGKVSARQMSEFVPIKATTTLSEILAWGYFNQIVDAGSQKLVYASGRNIKAQELDFMINQIQLLWPDAAKLHPDSSVFHHQPKMLKGVVFINPGTVPKAAISGRDKSVISGKVDVLRFGKIQESLVDAIEYIYINSWKEVHVASYEGISGLYKWLRDYLKWNFILKNLSDQSSLDIPSIICMNAHFGSLLSGRVMKLCAELQTLFFGEEAGREERFLIESAEQFFLFHKTEKDLKLTVYKNVNLLLKELERPARHFCRLHLDQKTLVKTLFPVIFEKNKEDVVQLFYLLSEKFAQIYILDECGGLFVQKVHRDVLKSVLHDYYVFFRAALAGSMFPDKSLAERERLFSSYENKKFECYCIRKNKMNYFVDKQDHQSLSQGQQNFYVSVTGSIEDGKKVFTFIVDGKTISSKKYGNEVFERLALVIKKKNLGNKLRPLNLSKVEIEHKMLGLKKSKHIKMMHLLKYKRVIEDKVNRELFSR